MIMPENSQNNLGNYLLPILAGGVAGSAYGALPHTAGMKKGLIRGLSAGAGATSGGLIADLIAEKLGLSPELGFALNMIGKAGGGYGGYRLARKYTKTLPEDLYDQGEEADKQRSKMGSAAVNDPSEMSARISGPTLAKLLAAGIVGTGLFSAIPGAIGGAVSPRGSGLLPGAARGFGVGAGALAGGIGGQLLANQMSQGNPTVRAIGGLLGTLIGGGLGYQGARSLTKTQKEQLEESMLDYYARHNALADAQKQPEKDEVPPPATLIM